MDSASEWEGAAAVTRELARSVALTEYLHTLVSVVSPAGVDASETPESRAGRRPRGFGVFDIAANNKRSLKHRSRQFSGNWDSDVE